LNGSLTLTAEKRSKNFSNETARKTNIPFHFHSGLGCLLSVEISSYKSTTLHPIVSAIVIAILRGMTLLFSIKSEIRSDLYCNI
jgi:hypothetical protein